MMPCDKHDFERIDGTPPIESGGYEWLLAWCQVCGTLEVRKPYGEDDCHFRGRKQTWVPENALTFSGTLVMGFDTKANHEHSRRPSARHRSEGS